jgi:uncharacterized protein (TIGR00297 family)
VIGVIAAAVVAILSYKIRFLNSGGAALAFLMGSIIFGFGGLAYTLPILGFFLLSSILSKAGKSKKKQLESTYQKSGVRDFHQALANGGVATAIVLIVFFTNFDALYYVYIAALAAATADTWGTELGIFSKSRPVLITNLKPVLPGTSGAISFLGSISALFGSLIIVLIGCLFYDFNFNQLILITLIGFIGSLIDSFLGATIQGQYRCKSCFKLTESKKHCQIEATLLSGNSRIDNDLVNIFSILFSSLVTFFIFYKDII